VIAAVAVAAMLVSSPAFPAGGVLPARFSCDGRNMSPPLRWTRPPARTKSLALWLTDPDAPEGVFTHWTLWNLPPTRRRLPTAVRWRLQGRNTFGRVGYSGPCPPHGSSHFYVFRIYAVDRVLSVARGSSADALGNALRGHVLTIGRLVASYGR
jgi:Raf kinase inhibitor-like YbhB/YbcL family protein